MAKRCAGDLADELGGGQWPAAGFGQQLRRVAGDEQLDLALEFADAPGALLDRADLLAGDPDSRGLLAARQPSREALQPDLAVQRAGRDVDVVEEVVQMPAQPTLLVGAVGDEIVVVVEQQPDLQRVVVQMRGGQPLDALAQRRPGDRQRVDRVALAPLAGAPAGAGHQGRRDPHDPLAAGQQPPLQPPRDVAAILDRPDPLAVAQATRPPERAFAAGDRRRDRLATQPLAGRRVDSHQRVRLLVRVRANHDHVLRPFVGCHWRSRITRRHTSLGGRSHAPIKSARRSTGGGGRHNRCRSDQLADSDAKSQSAADPGPNPDDRTSPPGTPNADSETTLAPGAAA